MVAVADILKKSNARKSKKPEKFQAVQRRAWDYLTKETRPCPTQKTPSEIWEQNKEQIRNENGNNEEQNGNNNGNIWEQNREQIKNEYTNQYGNNVSVSPAHSTSLVGRDILIEEVAQKRLLALTGHQKQIVRHIISHIKSKPGSPYVVEVFPNILAAKIKAELEVTRVTLKRLVQKNILVRLPGERGRSGCSKFKLYDNIVKICFTLFNDVPQNINLIGNEIGNENTNRSLYSSSINITTTSLPEIWEQVDISPLTAIGFSRTQLSQLVERNTPEIVQESINHFAFAIENNPKINKYTDPLNVLMGVLRKGQAWFEKNYISPKEQAMINLYEQKKLEAERLQNMEKKIIEEEFKVWLAKLTDEEKKGILSNVPQSSLLKNGILDKVNEGYLLNYFKKNVHQK